MGVQSPGSLYIIPKKKRRTEISQGVVDLQALGKKKIHPFYRDRKTLQAIRFHHRGFYFDWIPSTGKWCYPKNSWKKWRWARDATHLMEKVNGWCDWVDNKKREDEIKTAGKTIIYCPECKYNHYGLVCEKQKEN